MMGKPAIADDASDALKRAKSGALGLQRSAQSCTGNHTGGSGLHVGFIYIHKQVLGWCMLLHSCQGLDCTHGVVGTYAGLRLAACHAMTQAWEIGPT